MGVSMSRPATSVAAAVFVALYGTPRAATADPSDTPDTGASVASLQEVVVTANRRQQSLESVPYSISGTSRERVGPEHKRAD